MRNFARHGEEEWALCLPLLACSVVFSQLEILSVVGQPITAAANDNRRLLLGIGRLEMLENLSHLILDII